MKTKMNRNVVVCGSLIGLALLAGTAHAGPAAAAAAAGPVKGAPVYAGRGGGFTGLLPTTFPSLFAWRKRHQLPPEPRGMAVCKDTTSQAVCRAGLPNGDFEDTNDKPNWIEGWYLEAGPYSPAPYLGKTPDSRVLALPGQGALAFSSVRLPAGSAGSFFPEHAYTVKLRARGSGALPAEVDVYLAVTGDNDGEDMYKLEEVRRTVGWDWQDIEFRVDDLRVDGSERDPTRDIMMVGIRRADSNSSTMLQVDDVRVERTLLRQR